MASKPNKLAFLSMPAPASYVAGLGRGASGFTTRSDIGPAREGPSAEVIAEAQARRGEEEVDPEQFQDPDNEYGLFAGTTYEQDDEEADKIYEQVDAAMDSRRKARREAREQVELQKHRSERPKIQQQFSDLKRSLSSVSDAEWESIPEVGNLTRKKRPKYERTFAIPDSVLIGDRDKSGYENSLDPRQQETGGFETPAGTLTNFVEIGQARDKILSVKLDQISGISSTSGTATSVDPKGYLTSLDSVVLKSDAEIGDIKRARMLFDSLVKSNPKHGPGWIAAATLEEHAGRMVAARKLIKQGCEQCPTSEDVWLAAARLHNRDDAKVILANAVQHVGQSVNIWIAAADLEHEVSAKKRVFRKALEHIPNSVRLWKETVKLETSPADARVLLARAVELIPQSVELWLALAKLETADRAKAVLNKARKAVPTSHEIWVAAGQLLEHEGWSMEGEKRDKSFDMVDKTMDAAVRELRRHQVLLTREQWLKEAEDCEGMGYKRTSEAIVKATVAMEVEEQDQLETWKSDADTLVAKGSVATASAVLAYALRVFPNVSSLWMKAAQLEKANGTKESVDAILSRAVEHCPQMEDLWLMRAKEKWIAEDVPAAREVLEKAFIANPESEAIWLAAVKLESQNGEIAVARELLARARAVAGTAKIWVKSVKLERQQDQIPEALDLLSTALSKYPKFAKFYVLRGQMEQERGNRVAAREAYAAGIKACPKYPLLWLLASRLEELDNRSIRARALLDKARLALPKDEEIWAETVLVEERSGSEQQARIMLSRALQECPASGLLWSMAIWMEPRAGRKRKSADALEKTKGEAQVLCTVARLFWSERKIEKAREWFRRATSGDDQLGDTWGWWLKFERQHGTKEHREDVSKRCQAANPRRGIVWRSVLKDRKNTGLGTEAVLEKVADVLS